MPERLLLPIKAETQKQYKKILVEKFSDLAQFDGSDKEGKIKRRILGYGREAKSMVFM